jgi:DNA-binding transcriptional MerR regulator
MKPNITYRTINFWAEKGYLLTESKGGDWRAFSFAEFIWILFLDELRQLDVSFKKVLPLLFVEMGIPHNEVDLIEDSELEKLKNMDWEKLIHKMDKQTVLEHFCWELVTIISYRTPLTLRVFNDNTKKFIYGNPAYHGIKVKSLMDKYQQEVEASNFRSSISISIDSLIKDFIDKKDLNNISSVNIFSDQELKIIEELRIGNIKEVKIYFENEKPIRLDVVDQVNLVDVAKRVKENFFSDYQKCEYTTNGGNNYTLLRTTKKKLI